MNIDHKETMVVASPCVRNCCLNAADICIGCFRHIEEILAWTSYKNNEKKAVITLCGQRRTAVQEKLPEGKG